MNLVCFWQSAAYASRRVRSVIRGVAQSFCGDGFLKLCATPRRHCALCGKHKPYSVGRIWGIVKLMYFWVNKICFMSGKEVKFDIITHLVNLEDMSLLMKIRNLLLPIKGEADKRPAN